MRINDVLNALGEIQFLLYGPISRQEHEAYRDEMKGWDYVERPRPLSPEEQRKASARVKLHELFEAVGKEWIQKVVLPADIPFNRIVADKDEEGHTSLVEDYADDLEFRFYRNKVKYGARYSIIRQAQPEALPFVFEELVRALIKEIREVEG